MPSGPDEGSSLGDRSADGLGLQLAQFLRDAAVDLVADRESVSILYSGGLDSSAVARAIPASTKVELVTVGTAGSPDLDAGRSGAVRLGLPIRVQVVDEHAVRISAEICATLFGELREPIRSVLIATDLAVAAAPDRLVLCGQGADELFHGYSHLASLAPERAGVRAAADLRRLLHLDWPKAQQLARGRGHDLATPFLTPALVAWASSLPPDVHHSSSGRKPILRSAARLLNVPAELVDRPKKALQYGSGIHRELRRLDRRMDSGER